MSGENFTNTGGIRPLPPMLARAVEAIRATPEGRDLSDADAEAFARAAIGALRDPSGAMLRAMGRAVSPGRRSVPDQASASEKHRLRWQGGIEAALGGRHPEAGRAEAAE